MRSCFICRDSDTELYCTVDDYEHFRCSECGLVYVDRIETWERLYRSYNGGWFKSFRRIGGVLSASVHDS